MARTECVDRAQAGTRRRINQDQIVCILDLGTDDQIRKAITHVILDVTDQPMEVRGAHPLSTEYGSSRRGRLAGRV